VGGAAVGLHDDALDGPEEVRLLTFDDVVDEWSRDAVGGAEGKEDRFEVGARELPSR
jgi:hypothetical protein